MKFLVTAAAAFTTLAISTTAQAFCGFYVARADTGLFNRASQVVRHGEFHGRAPDAVSIHHSELHRVRPPRAPAIPLCPQQQRLQGDVPRRVSIAATRGCSRTRCWSA